jgi:hypothetical protein
MIISKPVLPRYKLHGTVRFGLREFCNWIAGRRQPSVKEKEDEKKAVKQ